MLRWVFTISVYFCLLSSPLTLASVAEVRLESKYAKKWGHSLVQEYPVFSPDAPGASGGPSSFGRGASREGGASGEGGHLETRQLFGKKLLKK